MLPSRTESADAQPSAYELVILLFSIYALGALAVTTLVRLDPGTRAILAVSDNALCAVFFVDFCRSLWRAPDKRRYMITWGWIDLLSSIPVLDAARWGRAARVARILRVLRGVRSVRVLGAFLLRRRSEAALSAAALLTLLLIVFSSIAILQLERSTESNIKTPGDAVWWAFVTVTTVGYGDRFPVTPEGRLMASLLMTAGVGLFGTFTGFVASWFLTPTAREEQAQREEQAVEQAQLSELGELRKEVAALRQLLEQQVARAAPPGGPPPA